MRTFNFGGKSMSDIRVMAQHLCFFVLLGRGMSPKLLQKTLLWLRSPGPFNHTAISWVGMCRSVCQGCKDTGVMSQRLNKHLRNLVTGKLLSLWWVPEKFIYLVIKYEMLALHVYTRTKPLCDFSLALAVCDTQVLSANRGVWKVENVISSGSKSQLST